MTRAWPAFAIASLLVWLHLGCAETVTFDEASSSTGSEAFEPPERCDSRASCAEVFCQDLLGLSSPTTTCYELDDCGLWGSPDDDVACDQAMIDLVRCIQTTGPAAILPCEDAWFGGGPYWRGHVCPVETGRWKRACEVSRP
ncbi:MAG: hypothetical protein AAGN82_19495 [Myxococcota bacterium]